MRFVSFCNIVIRWSFYLIFLLVPIIFWGDTSELFEFNKMWLTFILAIIIGVMWTSKMIALRQFKIQRTILDIPLLLFLLSQIISTIFSLDRHVSWWGYYSRFNGGLLSTITYIFLYYAFATNITEVKKTIIRILKISLVSGLIVSLWGLPSHFGYDPTCLLFRGNLDVSCWTDAFQPKVRIFSTMGQPDWLSAYLCILIPISMYFSLAKAKKGKVVSSVYYFLLTLLFYLDFIYTESKGGFIALGISLVFFFLGYILLSKESIKKLKHVGLFALSLFLITFFIGSPIQQINKFAYSGIANFINQKIASGSKTYGTKPVESPPANKIIPLGELGGTDSGKIRAFVWQGAIKAWLHNPIFGTGVETFAFAYYQYRPAGHNLTSEWDYLYNKAHNEYLNYLATTGAFGLLTYLSFIGLFLYLFTKDFYLFSRKTPEKKENISKIVDDKLLSLSLITAFLTILISNFFGFSVVIVNIYLFIIPLLVLFINDYLNQQNAIIFPTANSSNIEIGYGQKIGISVMCIIGIYLIYMLLVFWQADREYGYASNLDKVGQYQMAYNPIHKAVEARPDEPVFRDEMSINDANLAIAFAQQKDATNASKLVQEAIAASDDVTTNHPNYLVFWKTRVRIMYTFTQANAQFLQPAIDAIDKAHSLAPTDAKIDYNRGLLYAQESNQIDKAISILQETVKLKPDYRDAYYALGLMLRSQAVDKNNLVKNPQEEKEAVNTMHYILENLVPNDSAVKSALKSWGEK